MSSDRLDEQLCTQLRGDLLAASRRVPTRRHIIQTWELSSVERWFFPDDSSLICKIATTPFTGEATVLHALNNQQAPVPLLNGYTMRPDGVGMLMEDLGEASRTATFAEAAATARWVHAAAGIPNLPIFDEAGLARLPEQGLDALDQLRRQGRFTHDAEGIEAVLQRLAATARHRADGAERPPFGLCHGEFHRTSLHVSRAGCRVVDWAKAFTGPGLLDLATWFGTRTPTEPRLLTKLIHAYVAAGGHPDAEADRGGLPAARWALGWHRVWAAWWLLTTAAAGHHPASADRGHTQVVLRQLQGAADLLGAPPPISASRPSLTTGRSS
ncbi:aminoglycoside phosphotransferase [Micromonospora sp. WMMD710]|uniref:aminoglycoside phosphotransferase n=1 Tax=Micromonospora sp. WMMD710 TaxID=3016085 RepID=UPI002416B636|nr:aminoglycoside phosphotransferase [Micromonospora sp. WMMD710]MDG4760423.1 aminoglycoside phosphotransferase [Micromonospora sp. WMMD710]